MPQVGKKKFPYTPAGENQAQAFGKKTGQPVKTQKGKKKYSTALGYARFK
jgi:hypothetical protein